MKWPPLSSSDICLVPYPSPKMSRHSCLAFLKLLPTSAFTFPFPEKKPGLGVPFFSFKLSRMQIVGGYLWFIHLKCSLLPLKVLYSIWNWGVIKDTYFSIYQVCIIQNKAMLTWKCPSQEPQIAPPEYFCRFLFYL